MVCKIHEWRKTRDLYQKETGFFYIPIDNGSNLKDLGSRMVINGKDRQVKSSGTCGSSFDIFLCESKRRRNIPDIPNSYASVLGRNKDSP